MNAHKAILGMALLLPPLVKCHESPTQKIAVAPGTLAQSPDSTPDTVTSLDEALALAEKYSPLLEAGRAQIDAAEAGIRTARTYVNPEVNLLDGNQSTRMPSAVGGILQHYGVGQRIELPFQRKARIRAARIGRESTEFGLAERKLELRGTVKQAFYNVLRRKQEVEVARQNQSIVQEFRRRISVQVSTGEAAKLELTRADAELATATTMTRSAELQVVTATSALRAIIGASSASTIDPQGALSTIPQLQPMPDLLKRVLTEHPAFARAKTDVRQSEAYLDAEKTLRIPQPTAMAEYEQQPDLRFYRVGFALPIPIFDRRQGPIREAAARVRETNALVSQQRLELTSALETAYGQFQIANQQAIALQNGALKQAEAALGAAEAAYKFGERGIMDVLDAQRVLRSVRLDYLGAEYDRQAALIELEQLRALDLR
jgi:outer membrane protein, heavy metal efflux system